MTDIPTTFPPGEFIQDELDARGWTTADLAARMGGDNPGKDQLVVDTIIAVHDKRMVLDEKTIKGLSRAFGVSEQFFINLERAWRGVN